MANRILLHTLLVPRNVIPSRLDVSIRQLSIVMKFNVCVPGLVVEDAIAGIKSGNAAGARTLAVCTSTPRQTILDSDANPDYIVTDLTR
jgi:hypothetical protein